MYKQPVSEDRQKPQPEGPKKPTPPSVGAGAGKNSLRPCTQPPRRVFNMREV